MSFLTISNEIFFFKTQGTILGAIVAPNKGLEWVPIFSLFETNWQRKSQTKIAESKTPLFDLNTADFLVIVQHCPFKKFR